MLRLLALALFLMPSLAFANAQLIGVWQNVEEDIRLDILDGFKPNRGAVLSIEKDKKTNIGSWESKELDITIKLGWRSGVVRFRGSDSFEWENKIFNRSLNIVEDDIVLLKEDENAFIDGIVRGV